MLKLTHQQVEHKYQYIITIWEEDRTDIMDFKYQITNSEMSRSIYNSKRPGVGCVWCSKLHPLPQLAAKRGHSTNSRWS